MRCRRIVCSDKLHVTDESGGFSLCRRISRLCAVTPSRRENRAARGKPHFCEITSRNGQQGAPALCFLQGLKRPLASHCRLGTAAKKPCARLHYLLLWQKRKRPRCFRNVAFINAGNDLLSHTLSRAVQSALRGLTSVFGMGTGGSPAVRSPTSRSRQRLAVSFQQMLR